MRKSLWLITSLLAVIIAPSARADATYTYNFKTGSPTSLSWTLDDPNTAVIDLPTTFTTGITLNSKGSAFGSCPSINSVTINPVAGFVETVFFPCVQGALFAKTVPPTGLVDGTYFLSTFGFVDGTLVVSGVAPSGVPEPSSIALLLLGVGFVFVLRKRNSQLAT